jgi:ribose transport system substrate-binding protein
MKRFKVAALAFALGASAGPVQAQAPATKHLRIAVIGKSFANPVFLAAHRGAQDTAAQLGRKLGLSIDVSVLTPPTEDAALQARAIEQAVTDRVDAILIAVSDTARLTPAIDAAVTKRVAVMTFDSDAPLSKRFCLYGPDDVKVGELLVAELADRIGGSGKVALLCGNPDAPNLKARTEGARRAIARYPGLELVGAFSHVEKPQDAVIEVMRVNAAFPDLKGWVMVGGWPLFRSSQSLSLINDLTSRKLAIVAVDALPEQLLYVDKGLAVLYAQPVYDWGRVGVTTIVDKLHLHKEIPAHIPMELIRVDRDNLGEWARQLQSWGFSIDPAQYQRD